jgi:hypothetical protein
MYNLLISGNDDAWENGIWFFDEDRCVTEYTDKALIEQFGQLDDATIDALKKLPCIFAYESSNKLNPKFGVIRGVEKRQKKVRIEFELIPVKPFLSATDLESMLFELDIGKWELNRTHWAVKNVDLTKELNRLKIELPHWVENVAKSVDVKTHNFDVALSFPGESRILVKEIAANLERLIGKNAYFYDENYVSQLARPSLDLLLQDIYGNRSKLVVVFVGADYQTKDWCGIEFRAIRDIISRRQADRVMFIRTDDGPVEGVFANDGYVDARRFNPLELANFIKERVELQNNK